MIPEISNTPPDPLETTSSTILADLFALGQHTTDEIEWNDNDLGAILAHQLAQSTESFAADGSFRGSRSYLALFTEPSPPVDSLRAAKDRFKINSALNDPSDLPRDVCITLYYAALAAARLHAGTSISQLDDDAFRVGLKWALDLPWLDPALRSLFTRALEQATPSP